MLFLIYVTQILTVICAFCTGLLAIWIQCGNTRKPRQVQGKQDGFITNIPIDEPSERSEAVRIKQPPGAYNPMYMKSPKSSTVKKKADAERSGKPNSTEKTDKQPSERTAIPGSELKSKLSTVSKKKETKKAASGVDKSGKNSSTTESSGKHRKSGRSGRKNVVRVEGRGADSKRSLAALNSDRTQSDAEHDDPKPMTKTKKERDEWKEILKAVNDESKKNSTKNESHKRRKEAEKKPFKAQRKAEVKSKVTNLSDMMTNSLRKSKRSKKKSKKDSTKEKEKSARSVKFSRHSKERLNSVRRKLRDTLSSMAEQVKTELDGPGDQLEGDKKPKPEDKSMKSKSLLVPQPPSRGSRRTHADVGSEKSKGKSTKSKRNPPKSKKGE